MAQLQRSLAGACCLAAAGCGGSPPAEPPADATAWFRETAAESGLDFVHFNGMTGGLYLAEITCGAGALFDADGDGDLDAYLLQGSMLGPGETVAEALFAPRHQPPLTDRFYRNDLASLAGGGRSARFVDATAAAGLGADDGYGCAVAVGDIDGDGRADLFVGNLGPDRLLRNLGGGRFADVTAGSGLGDPRNATTATFFDFDGDGDLDLFVGHYGTFDNTGATVCRSLTGAPDYCGPGAYPFEQDVLYENLGGGRFRDVTATAGLAAAPPRPALGSVAADFDGDGRLDLYVANDGQPNHLWINLGDGTFREAGMLAGAAVNAAGASEASMGVAADDADNDGDVDLLLTHLVRETNTFYRNDGRGFFEDATAASGLGPPSLPFTGFGAGWLDFDGDGWLDLLTVNGAVTRVPDQVEAGDPFPLRQTRQLFRNLGGDGSPGRFVEVTAQAGPAFALAEVGRGAAFGDVDEDGDTDVLVINNNGPARLLIDDGGDRGPWVGLRLLTGEPPRDALGATVTLSRRGAPPLTRRAHSDGSYASASDPRVLFALAGAEVAGVRVAWPDGSVEEFPAPPPGRYSSLRQGAGRPGER